MNIQVYLKIVYPYIAPIALTVGSIIIGFIFDKVVLRKLKKIAERTVWEGDDIIIESLQGKFVWWFLILGIYVSLHTLPLKKSVIEGISKFSIVILIFTLTLVIGRITAGFVKLYSRKAHGVVPATTLIANLSKLFIIIIGLLVIMQYLGISITPILTALGVGGLAVALALQDTLSNLFSGIHLIVTRQIKLADYVKLETGEEGHVTDITWRNTTIRTIQNNIVVIPNSKLASTIITNYSLSGRELLIRVPVGVSYDSDLDMVEQVTREVAKEVLKELPGGISDYEPIIRFHTFDDFSINFNVILRAREFVDQYPLVHEFIKRLHKRYKLEGIEIPFPIRTVYMKDNQNK